MSSQNVKVVGIPTRPGQDGSLPLRREIRNLEANFPDQFNLFVLGMRALQARPKDDPTSYYQIAAPIPDSLARLAPDNQYTDWIVNVRTLKHGLSQTYRVVVFLGDFSPNPLDWAGNAEYNTVGRVTVLGRSADTPCTRCREDQDSGLVVAGAVPLTSALLQDITAGKLASLEMADVVPYLRRHLHWRVKLWTGEAHPVAEVPGLKVSVCSSRVRIGEDGIPGFSREYTTHFEVTAGRTGGLGEDDD